MINFSFLAIKSNRSLLLENALPLLTNTDTFTHTQKNLIHTILLDKTFFFSKKDKKIEKQVIFSITEVLYGDS